MFEKVLTVLIIIPQLCIFFMKFTVYHDPFQKAFHLLYSKRIRFDFFIVYLF